MEKLALVGLIMLASIIEIWVASKNCEKLAECEGENAYAIVVGGIGIGLTNVYYVNHLKFGASGMVADTIALLLPVFWLAAIAVCTMEGPFSVTADNGFYATWIAMISSILVAPFASISLHSPPPASISLLSRRSIHVTLISTLSNALSDAL